MASNRMDDDTQIRIIKAEARTAVIDECDSILSTIRNSAQEIKRDIKEEMHRYFATKTDLETWKLSQYKETEQQITKLVKECEKKNHSFPGGRFTSINPSQWTLKKSAKYGGLVTGLGIGTGTLVLFVIKIWEWFLAH